MSDVEFCNLAYDGRVAMLKASLEKDGGLVRRRDANKRTALHWACSSGRNEVVGVLLSKGAEVQLQFSHPPTRDQGRDTTVLLKGFQISSPFPRLHFLLYLITSLLQILRRRNPRRFRNEVRG